MKVPGISNGSNYIYELFQKTRSCHMQDSADYILYTEPDFVLFKMYHLYIECYGQKQNQHILELAKWWLHKFAGFLNLMTLR